MLSSTTKTMLKNVIRHTDTHNRIVEETDMWKQLNQVKEREGDPRRSFLYDDRHDVSPDSHWRGSRHAYMDDGNHKDDDSSGRKSTFWQRQLQKAEEADPDRWGHSGYKELYPHNFKSDRSEDSEDSMKTKKKRKKEKKKMKRKRDEVERKHHDRNEFSSESKNHGQKHKHKSYKNRTKSSSESDQSDVSLHETKYTQIDEQTGKRRKNYREALHHGEKLDRYSEDDYDREHSVRITLMKRTDNDHRSLRDSYDDRNNKRKHDYSKAEEGRYSDKVRQDNFREDRYRDKKRRDDSQENEHRDKRRRDDSQEDKFSDKRKQDNYLEKVYRDKRRRDDSSENGYSDKRKQDSSRENGSSDKRNRDDSRENGSSDTRERDYSNTEEDVYTDKRKHTDECLEDDSVSKKRMKESGVSRSAEDSARNDSLGSSNSACQTDRRMKESGVSRSAVDSARNDSLSSDNSACKTDRRKSCKKHKNKHKSKKKHVREL